MKGGGDIMDNWSVAQRLMKHARLLEAGCAGLYRARAYRRAAATILGLDEPVRDIVEQRGQKGLRELPGIGNRISSTIASLVRTGEIL